MGPLPMPDMILGRFFTNSMLSIFQNSYTVIYAYIGFSLYQVMVHTIWKYVPGMRATLGVTSSSCLPNSFQQQFSLGFWMPTVKYVQMCSYQPCWQDFGCCSMMASDPILPTTLQHKTYQNGLNQKYCHVSNPKGFTVDEIVLLNHGVVLPLGI